MIKKMIFVFLFLFLVHCGGDSEGAPRPGTDSPFPSTDKNNEESLFENSDDTESQENFEEDMFEEPSSSPIESLACTSGSKTITFNVLHYNEPYPACRHSLAVNSTCRCELEVLAENGVLSIIAYATRIQTFCKNSLDKIKTNGFVSFSNGRSYRLPAGYTCN